MDAPRYDFFFHINFFVPKKSSHMSEVTFDPSEHVLQLQEIIVRKTHEKLLLFKYNFFGREKKIIKWKRIRFFFLRTFIIIEIYQYIETACCFCFFFLSFFFRNER